MSLKEEFNMKSMIRTHKVKKSKKSFFGSVKGIKDFTKKDKLIGQLEEG